jgi:hypothetical protein
MVTIKREQSAGVNPVLDAKTIGEFVVAVNRELGLNLPERWPEGSEMAQLYALHVTVTTNEGGTGFTATATTLFPTLGGASSGLSGRTTATVTISVDSFPAP